VLINSTGGAECIQIDFTPVGARRFFSLPMDEISARLVKLDELDDREIKALRSQLVEQRNWMKRLDLVEQFVRKRLRRNVVGSAAVAWAYERIVRSQGDIRISSIANALDWSRKHLVARFKKEIGVGPKTIARMVRFSRVLALAQAARSPDWAELAVACGYADQAHLVREFREFTGNSPTAFLRRAASSLVR
jgi:AraC-like DNA-binding protein